MELNRDDPTSIGKMQDLTVDGNLEYNNLAYIKSNFDSSRRFHSNFNKKEMIKEKVFKKSIRKNTGFDTMCIILKILDGTEMYRTFFLDDLCFDSIGFFRYIYSYYVISRKKAFKKYFCRTKIYWQTIGSHFYSTISNKHLSIAIVKTNKINTHK